ncbi:CGGC domain-containing protein [Fusibacter sp. JL216-2]|uniref:CGGC domain-containing protein n=1 Tax=Fusibacter sp. JL216-2 TaxID=3071453 RepID=UPI003D32601B
MDPKYAVLIQCQIAKNRCSGFACTNAFYNRDEMFKDYPPSTKYIAFTCGGCCGKGTAAKLEHFTKKLAKAEGLSKNEIVVHLASCMVTDNHHYDRCPHVEYIKKIIGKHGYNNIVEKTYISKNAHKRRCEGQYNTYE